MTVSEVPATFFAIVDETIKKRISPIDKQADRSVRSAFLIFGASIGISFSRVSSLTETIGKG